MLLIKKQVFNKIDHHNDIIINLGSISDLIKKN